MECSCIKSKKVFNLASMTSKSKNGMVTTHLFLTLIVVLSKKQRSCGIIRIGVVLAIARCQLTVLVFRVAYGT